MAAAKQDTVTLHRATVTAYPLVRWAHQNGAGTARTGELADHGAPQAFADRDDADDGGDADDDAQQREDGTQLVGPQL